MDPGIRLKSHVGRWVLLATVLGSGVAFLDATVVNVALPTIGKELHATVGHLQRQLVAALGFGEHREAHVRWHGAHVGRGVVRDGPDELGHRLRL